MLEMMWLYSFFELQSLPSLTDRRKEAKLLDVVKMLPKRSNSGITRLSYALLRISHQFCQLGSYLSSVSAHLNSLE